MIFTWSFWAFHDIPGLGKYGFWIKQTLNTNNLTTASAKSVNLHTTRTLFEYSWKKVGAKAMFILIVFEISLSESRLVLWPSPQWPSQGAKALKFQQKTKQNIRNLLILLKKWLTYKLRVFRMVSIFFWFSLTLWVLENLKNSVFEMPIITQTLNINNLRTTSAKSINLHTSRNLVEYSLKNVEAMVNVYSNHFGDIAVKR